MSRYFRYYSKAVLITAHCGERQILPQRLNPTLSKADNTE